MPAFGTASIRGMMEDMRDICNQMLVKWERLVLLECFELQDNG